MLILYTDGNSTDAGASTSQHRDDRSDKMKHSKKERHRPLRQSRCEVLQEQRQELLGDGMKTDSETSKDVLRYHDVSPAATRHLHDITVVPGVRKRTCTEAKSSLPEKAGSPGTRA
ncbi:hypothetical protein MRX96_006501 [Rhipicephalus microplus]